MKRPGAFLRKSVFLWPMILISCSTLARSGSFFPYGHQKKLDSYKKANLLAKTNGRQEACAIFKDLSAEEDFSLKELATLQAYISCDQASDVSLPFQPWYRPLWNEARLKQSYLKEDLPLYLESLKEKVLRQEKNSDKVFILDMQISKSRSDQRDLWVQALLDLKSQIAPRYLSGPTKKDYLAVANDYLAARDFERARFYFKKFLDESLTSEEAYLAWKGIRQSYKIELKKKDHIQAAEKLAIFCSKNKMTSTQTHEAYTVWARAVWTEGDRTRAEEILRKFLKSYPSLANTADIYFLLGRIKEEELNYLEAITNYELALNHVGSQDVLRDKVRFFLAWNYYQLKNYPKAAEVFQNHFDSSKDNSEKAKARFWQGKSLLLAGNQSQAQESFVWLQQNDPMGYYGLLSFRETQTPIPALRPRISIDAIPALPEALTQLLKDLSFVSETESLRSLLAFEYQKLRNSGAKPKETLPLLREYALAGLYQPLFGLVAALDSTSKTEVLDSFPELLFPMKFSDPIISQSDRFQVPAELIFSIIRQESSFNPQARSPVDALGLMQMMPQMVESLKSLTGISIQHFEELYDPEVNITLGTALLKKLRDKYQHQFILTAAGYNANDRAIQQWLKTRWKGDPLMFIEDIPYEETKGYVKLVLRNFVFYQRLRTKKDSVIFPEWTLKGLEKFEKLTP